MEEITEYKIVNYEDSKIAEWDNFIDLSLNGTFLQSRRFLNYHPKDRFLDCSLMVYNKKNNLVAICPACCKDEGGQRVFFSHLGSTFGGILISEKSLHVNKLTEIIIAIEKHCINAGFNKIVFKPTSNLFSVYNNDLLEYSLYYLGYQEFKELNLYIDFSKYKDNILSNFSQGKRTNINNCIKKGIELKKLDKSSEIKRFYNILCQTLEKYDRLPVHNLSELLMLKNEVLVQECEFYGAYIGEEMIAGSMMFYFKKAGVAHTQYLCAMHEYDTLSPMSFMYYAMIDLAKKNGFKAISFGIATEDYGRYINNGLVSSKEAFGSLHSLNKIYYKTLMNKGDIL